MNARKSIAYAAVAILAVVLIAPRPYKQDHKIGFISGGCFISAFGPVSQTVPNGDYVKPPSQATANTNNAYRETFVAFDDWMREWDSSDSVSRSKILAQGVQLARMRRDDFTVLFESSNRSEALELTIPEDMRLELPFDVLAEIEFQE